MSSIPSFAVSLEATTLPDGAVVYRAGLVGPGSGGAIVAIDKDPAQALIDAATNWRNERRRIAREIAAKAAKPKRTAEDYHRAQSAFTPRSRGSSIDWDALVPAEVAAQQRRWERYRNAAAMRSAGLRMKDIAARMGVSATVAGGLCRGFDWRNRFRPWVSPVESYLTDDRDARRLAGALKD